VERVTPRGLVFFVSFSVIAAQHFEVLRLACVSKQSNVAIASLDCMQKLIA
jgi:hypothetical protein